MAQFVTTVQAARILGVTRRRVDALIAAGRLPAHRVGRDWLIQVPDLARVKDRPWGRPPKKRTPGASRARTSRRRG